MAISTAELIADIRQLICDEGSAEYSDDKKLLVHINQAITFLNKSLIAAGSPFMVKEANFTNNMLLPADYERACGQYPYRIVGGTIKLLSGTSLPVQYLAHKPRVATVSDMIDFPNQYFSAIAQVAAMFALNRNEFEVKQDEALLAMLL